MSNPKTGDLVVAETSTSTWHYHLRIIGPEGFRPSGYFGFVQALCGRTLGWDVSIPVSTYGVKDDYLAHWCRDCQDEALERKLL